MAYRQAIALFASRLAGLLDEIYIVTRLQSEAFSLPTPPSAHVIRIKPLAGQVRAKPKALSPVVILLSLLLHRPAQAQEAKVVTPLDLFEPERGAGVPVGPSLLLFPTVEIDAAYDTNIYNSRQAELDDLVASFRPHFTLRTRLPRHQVSLTGGADIRRHAKIEAENSEQFNFQAKGSLDLAERTEVVADAGFRRGIEQRGTAGDQFLTDEPVAFDRKFAGLLVGRRGGFLEVTAEGRISETNYLKTRVNGFPVDLSERNSAVKSARIRGSAPSSHYSRIFVEASINRVSYEQSAQLQRDSSGYALLAGMLFRLTNLVDLEAGAGYIHQNFDNPSIKDVSAVNFHIQVNWTPRPDWQISASANRTVDPSPRLDVPAIVRSGFSLEARKSIGDRTLVSAEIGIIDEKYQGIGRKDQRFRASVGAHYRLTNHVGVVARASWRKQNGNEFGRDYAGVTATLGMRFRF